MTDKGTEETTTQDRGHESDDIAARPSGSDTGGKRDGSRIETLAAWLSGIVVAVVAAVLVREGMREQQPASFDIRLGEVRETGGKFYADIIVENQGDEPAQQVELRAEVSNGGQIIDDAEALLDWSPGRSRKHVRMIFDKDPRQNRTEVRVAGYADP